MNTIFTDKAPAAIGPYSQAQEVNGIVYTSGQIAIDPATANLVDGGIEAQTEQVCQNIKNLLEAAGTNLDKVIKTTCFITNMGDFSAFNQIYGKYFTKKPARSCVEVSALPKGALCEIEVIAEK